MNEISRNHNRSYLVEVMIGNVQVFPDHNREPCVIEALGIHIKTCNLAVVIVYRTPDDPKHNRKSAEKEFSQFLKAARDCLKKTSSSYT